MEERFPASILVVAGLLRVAGASRSEPWSSHTTDQSSLDEGLVTATGHLVPIREEDAAQVTLRLETFTSDFPNDGISHPPGFIRTEAEEDSEDGGQPLTFPDRQQRRSELSSLEGAILGHQGKDPPTHSPQISGSVLGGLPETVAESANQPEPLTTSLPREARIENATGHDLRGVGVPSSLDPAKAAEMGLLTTWSSEPSESAGQETTRDSSPFLATRPGNPHTFTLDTKTTKSEVVPDETKLTPAKEMLRNLQTLLPTGSQQLLVDGGPEQLDLRTSEIPGTPGLLGEAQLSFSAPSGQRPLSEEHAATQQLDFASSLHGKTMMRGQAVGLQTVEDPALWAPSQSHARSSPLLLTPETLPSGSPPPSALPGDAGQRDQPRSVFRPQPPPSSNPDEAEQPLHESVPFTLQRETHHQTTIQPSPFEPSQTTAPRRDPLPVSKVQETTPEASGLTQEQPHVSTLLVAVYGEARGRVLSMPPLDKTTSLHALPTMRHVAASSPIQPPLPDMPDAAGRVTQGISKIPLPSTFPHLIHGQQASLSTSAPPSTELFASSSASVPTKPPTPGIPAAVNTGPTRLSVLASLPTVPQHELEELSMEAAASLPAKLPTPGNLASAYAGPHSSAATDSAHLTPRPLELSSFLYGEPQGRALGMPFQAEHQRLGNSVSTPDGPTVPETTLPPPVETGTAAAGLDVLDTPVHDFPTPKLSPEISSPFHALTQPLLTGAYSELQPAPSSMPARSPQVPELGATRPTHGKSQKPGASASFLQEPQLFATSVHAHAKPNTEEAVVEGSLPVSTEARTSIPAHAKAPRVLSVHAQAEQHLSHASAQFGGRPPAHSEAQTPNTPDSSPVQLLGHLRPQPSRSSIFVSTELQPQPASTSAEVATPHPKVATAVHPNPYLPTTPALPGVYHTTAKEENGKTSLHSSLPASQPGTDTTPLPGISVPVPSQKAEGRDRSSDTPSPSSPVSQSVRHKNVNLPTLGSVRVAEHFPGLGTTPVLAGDEAQDLLQSSRGFLLHLLNQSDATVDGNLDSAVDSSYHGIPSSLPYLSFLIRGAENMICLQPVQNATSPAGESKVSGPGVTSLQEMLISSTFLGLSHPGASSLTQTHPSSVLLVKPMFFFLPANEPGDPLLPSAEEEEEHADGHLFSNVAVLRLVASSHEQLAESYSTIRQSTRADSLSTNSQAISGSALSSVREYTAGSSRGRSTTLKAEPFPNQLREAATTKMKPLESRGQEEGFLLSLLDPPESGESNAISLSVERRVSATPPMMGHIHQSPKMVPSTTELLSSPPRITSLHNTMEHSASPTLTRASRSKVKPQPNTTMVLHAEEDHPLGSMTPITASSKNSEEPVSTSSSGNTELPLEEAKYLTPLRAVSHRFLVTKVFRKYPSEIQHMPSTVSGFLTFSAVGGLTESAAVNDSHSEGVPALPRATETSSYVTNATLAEVSKSPLFSPIPLRASERPRTPPLPTPFLAYTQAHTPLSEKRLEDMDLQAHSRPPVPMSSQASTNFATSAMKDQRANPMLPRRASLTSTERQADATVSNDETGKNMSETEIHNPREVRHFTPTMLGTDSALPFPAGFNSASVASGGTVGSIGSQTEIHKTPLTTFHSLSPSSTHQDSSASPVSRGTPPSEAPHTELRSLRLIVTAATNKIAFFSPSTAEEELIQHGKGQKAEVSPPFPTSSHLEGDHQVTARLSNYKQTQDFGSSMPSPNNTSSSSLGPPILTEAPEFLLTMLSSGAPSVGPVDKVLHQTSHLRSLPVDNSEMTLNLHTQVLLSPESLLDTAEVTAEGDIMVEATSAGEFDESYLHTMGEQETVVMDATEEAAKDSRAVLQQADSSSSQLDRKMPHRRPTRSDDVFLDGFAVVSDDACGSGNYTTEMSLRRATGQPPSHPDTFLALILLHSNSSCPTLRVQSCCVTPTARPTGPDAACCFFPRTPPECRSIQLHQNGKSRAARITIQLFQMLNCSVAYLHCELSICLRNHPGCEQSCSENRETHFKPPDWSSYQTLHNLISFGPVLKAQPESPSGLATESELAMMFPVLLGSLAGIVILLGISTFIWFHQRSKIKMAANLDEEGLCTP